MSDPFDAITEQLGDVAEAATEEAEIDAYDRLLRLAVNVIQANRLLAEVLGPGFVVAIPPRLQEIVDEIEG